MRVPIAPHPYQHLVLSVFWILAILVGVFKYLIVLLFNSLMTHDGPHLFSAYLPSVYLLLVRCLSRTLAHFLTGSRFLTVGF